MEADRDTSNPSALSRCVLQQVVASSLDGVLLVDARDPGLAVAYVNPSYEALSGYPADELVGRPWPLLERDAGADLDVARLKAAVGRSDACDISVTDIGKDGRTWSCDLSVRPLYSARGELRFFLCLHRPRSVRTPDETSVEVGLLQRALGQARQRLASLDQIDAVTGLLRYEHFTTLLTRDLGVARRDGKKLVVLAFEIVELDTYRRTFGSNAADSCLRMVGAQVAGVFRRAGDLTARCDESLIMAVAQNHDPEQAEPLARRVADKVRGLGLHNPRATSGRYVSVRSAIVAARPETDDAAALTARAREALGADESAREAATG